MNYGASGINVQLLTRGKVHCRQSDLAFVCSIAYLSSTRTSARPEPGNEPYPKPLGKMLTRRNIIINNYGK